MKRIFVPLSLVLVVFITYVVVEVVADPQSRRMPAAAPANYDSLSACEKQTVLWSEIEKSAHDTKNLPAFKKFGLLEILGLAAQELSTKNQNYSDFAPTGWKKYLHARGAIAKVKMVPGNHSYTGVFEGTDCALIRLSLTYKVTGSRPVAPGLALKVLRTDQPSANVSALVALNGQGKDFNFFKNPMSNIVPMGSSFGEKWVHAIFKSYSDYPEELRVDDMATYDSAGNKAATVVAPRQLIFVPNQELGFSSAEHDIREDLLSIPSGTILYKVYAVNQRLKDYDYSKYSLNDLPNFLQDAQFVADIVTTSPFIASEFGDFGILFRHQIRPSSKEYSSPTSISD